MVVLLACLATSACSVDGLVFREDRRITFATPDYREVVRTPVLIDWEVSGDLALSVDGESRKLVFAVLVDVDPPPPGESLAYYARDDESCRVEDGCPDADYLARKRVFTTTETSYVLETLVEAPGVDVDRGDRDMHDVTIILLDGEGRRASESAWTITFEVAGESDD